MEWDARGLVQVIKACASEGVSKFKLDSLEITFLQKPDTMNSVQEVIGAGVDQITFRPVSEEDEQRIKEMQFEEMLISDPLAYENSALGDDNSDQD